MFYLTVLNTLETSYESTRLTTVIDTDTKMGVGLNAQQCIVDYWQESLQRTLDG